MFKRLLLLLWVIIWAGLAVADPMAPQAPFLPFSYTITGRATVTEEGGSTAANRVVAFFLNDYTQRITAETNASGQYTLNAYDLNYYYGIPITFETQAYYLAIPSSEGRAYANYGTWESIYLSPLLGYTIEALVITESGWTEMPGQPVGELSILTSSLPGGTVGSAYIATLEATGGTAPYAWTAEATSLPPGLALSTDGILTGTLTSAGTYEVVFSVTDASSTPAMASRILTIEVLGVPPVVPPPVEEELSIVTETLPVGSKESYYIATLEASGGTRPYAWTAEATSLPPGLVLNTDGVLTGTLTSAGTYEVTFEVTDSSSTSATVSRILTIEVVGVPPVEPPVVPPEEPTPGTEGVIPLFISRSGSDVKVSWEAADYPSQEIYVLTGDGSGQFINTYEAGCWLSITDPSLSYEFDMSHRTSGYILHKNQVGQGTAEAYYKAFIPGADLSSATGQTLFASAEAVGKFNLALYTGWNFVASPFSSSTPDHLLGTSFSRGDQIWVWNDETQEYRLIQGFGASSWGESYTFTRGSGVLLNLVGSSTTITLLGNVDLTPFSRTMYANWNFISSPYPTISSMSEFSSVSGDQLWEWSAARQEFESLSSFTSAWSTGAEVKAGRNYLYNRVGSSFTWSKTY